MTLGGFIDGVPVRDGALRRRRAATGCRRFRSSPASGWWSAYALLGSTWLVMKTEGLLQPRMRALARKLAWVLLGCHRRHQRVDAAGA